MLASPRRTFAALLAVALVATAQSVWAQAPCPLSMANQMGRPPIAIGGQPGQFGRVPSANLGGGLALLGGLQNLQTLAAMQQQMALQQRIGQMQMQQRLAIRNSAIQQSIGRPTATATATSARTVQRDVSAAAADRAAKRESRRKARLEKLRARRAAEESIGGT